MTKSSHLVQRFGNIPPNNSPFSLAQQINCTAQEHPKDHGTQGCHGDL